MDETARKGVCLCRGTERRRGRYSAGAERRVGVAPESASVAPDATATQCTGANESSGMQWYILPEESSQSLRCAVRSLLDGAQVQVSTVAASANGPVQAAAHSAANSGNDQKPSAVDKRLTQKQRATGSGCHPPYWLVRPDEHSATRARDAHGQPRFCRFEASV